MGIQRLRQLTVFQSGNAIFDRWQRDVIGILNPLLQSLNVLATPVDAEVPSGTINGTTGSDGNAKFKLVFSPNPPESLILVKSRSVMMPGTDFTIANEWITFLAPQIPKTGDQLVAWYTR